MQFNEDEIDRQYSHTFEVPRKPVLPDQWVNWGDVTVQVDPIRDQKWIFDGDDAHKTSADRGRSYDRSIVQRLVNWETTHTPKPVDYFNPASQPVRDCTRFPSSCLNNVEQYNKYYWRGFKRDSSRWGLLPSVTAMIYENRLPDKPEYDIESEIRESEKLSLIHI